jgi:sugar-phosphatase
VAIEAAVFDMDGLLIDSEILWHKAELEILGGLGAPIGRDDARTTKGMFVAQVVDYWHELAPWESPSKSAVTAAIVERVGQLVESEGRLMPGALRAIDLASSLGPIAVASSTPRGLIERSLSHFSILERFAAIATAADEEFGKPHPGVFITAARRLGVAPGACVAFEDSAAGVLAAKAATMTCVAVPAIEDRGLAAFAVADEVLGSLVELDARWLTSLFGA